MKNSIMGIIYTGERYESIANNCFCVFIANYFHTFDFVAIM